jgi:hypothetical protein
MAKEPTYIYAILAYSKSLNVTKRIFDEDALLTPYNHTTREALAEQKATAFAAQLNSQVHQGATDWVARIKKQDYKTRGLVRAAEIKSPRNTVKGI